MGQTLPLRLLVIGMPSIVCSTRKLAKSVKAELLDKFICRS